MRAHRLNSILVRIVMLLAGLAIAFAALELIFRILPANKSKFVYSKERPAFFFRPQESNNMRGNESGKQKAKGEFRIVVLGDSFSFGPAMQYLDPFPKRLEGMLNTASRVSVINLGTPGHSTMNEWRTFPEALSYSPDVILLQVTLNDPQKRSLQREPEAIRGSFGPYKPRTWLAKHSRFISWVGARLHNTRSVSSYIRYHEYLWENNWLRFAKPFEEMRSQAAAAHVGFGVILFPLFDFPLTKDEYPFTDIHRRIGEFVRSTHTPFLDLFSAFEGIDPYRMQLLPGRDSHPNEIAHRIAAEKIYWWMRRQPFFPKERKLNPLYPKRANVIEKTFRSGKNPSKKKQRPVVREFALRAQTPSHQ